MSEKKTYEAPSLTPVGDENGKLSDDELNEVTGGFGQCTGGSSPSQCSYGSNTKPGGVCSAGSQAPHGKCSAGTSVAAF